MFCIFRWWCLSLGRKRPVTPSVIPMSLLILGRVFLEGQIVLSVCIFVNVFYSIHDCLNPLPILFLSFYSRVLRRNPPQTLPLGKLLLKNLSSFYLWKESMVPLLVRSVTPVIPLICFSVTIHQVEPTLSHLYPLSYNFCYWSVYHFLGDYRTITSSVKEIIHNPLMTF